MEWAAEQFNTTTYWQIREQIMQLFVSLLTSLFQPGVLSAKFKDNSQYVYTQQEAQRAEACYPGPPRLVWIPDLKYARREVDITDETQLRAEHRARFRTAHRLIHWASAVTELRKSVLCDFRSQCATIIRLHTKDPILDFHLQELVWEMSEPIATILNRLHKDNDYVVFREIWAEELGHESWTPPVPVLQRSEVVTRR